MSPACNDLFFGTSATIPTPETFNDEGVTVSYQALAYLWLGSFMAVVFIDIYWRALHLGVSENRVYKTHGF